MARAAARKPAKKTAKRYRATPADRSDREHLIGVIRDNTGCTAAAARETFASLVGTITASLKKNKQVQVRGFGTFVVARRRAHAGRNPRTGEKIRVKASKTVRFKSGKTLKESI